MINRDLQKEDERYLVPFNAIRIEAELSRYPIHKLAKKGRVDIRINKRNIHGELTLQWEVSYNDRYGQAGPLAYKVDTLVINRRLDELGRPLPKIIKLESLKKLCKELGLAENGTNKKDLKNAILQNAGALITAKIKYRTTDGIERWLESVFTRYSVRFFGEALPDGKKADAVYIVLNEEYWQVLNSAPVRPLNYDYLKALPPAPQRFYEIISRIFYTTMRYKHKHAILRYSEYCILSAQTRSFDFNSVRPQMYRVHKPHLQSGYVKDVRYEKTTDEDGMPDWIMYYVPGLKAIAEYEAFNRKRFIDVNATDNESELKEEEGSEAWQGKRKPKSKEIDAALLTELSKRGIPENTAKKLLLNLAENQYVMDQLEWGDYLIAQAERGKFRNPPGFYIHLIKSNITPPETFETTRQFNLRREARLAQERREQEQARLWLDYEDYQKQTIDTYMAEHYTPEQLQELAKAKKNELLHQKKGSFTYWKEAMLTDFVERQVRADMAKQISFLSFERFCDQRKSRTHS